MDFIGFCFSTSKSRHSETQRCSHVLKAHVNSNKNAINKIQNSSSTQDKAATNASTTPMSSSGERHGHRPSKALRAKTVDVTNDVDETKNKTETTHAQCLSHQLITRTQAPAL